MKKILVVEDELIILKFVVFRLEKEGYEVLSATDGRVALDIIQNRKPDLVLLDVFIPSLDGYEVCKCVKEDTKLRHIPVILFTASEPTIVAHKGKEVGADDYIIKPFDPEQLLEKIKKFIG
ncbi:MAG: response regulator [Candidatus Omnitrophota bacterium]